MAMLRLLRPRIVAHFYECHPVLVMLIAPRHGRLHVDNTTRIDVIATLIPHG